MSSSLKKSSSQDTLRGASTPDIAKADIYDEGVVDPVYAAKSHVLNRALQEIGMGKYQVSASCLNLNSFDHSYPWTVRSGVSSLSQGLVGFRTSVLCTLWQ